MSCGCGSVYTLTPGDRLYLSAMVKSLQQRVSALEGGGVSSGFEAYIDTRITTVVPDWALQLTPPITEEVDPTVPTWAKQPTKPTYTVTEISGAASETYVDAHSNRTDNPHNVTAAQIGAVLASDLAPVAFSGDFDDLSNPPILGSAAFANIGDFATVAEGALATSAVQPEDLNALAFESDAPADGTSYTRKNNAWVAAVVGGPAGNFTDLGDVPSSYVSQAGKFVAVNAAGTGLVFVPSPGSALSDAPSDGKLYGRLNGGWVEIIMSGGGTGDCIPGRMGEIVLCSHF